MGKLHLKETPEERERRKTEKARRSRKHSRRTDDTENLGKKRHRKNSHCIDQDTLGLDEDHHTFHQGHSSKIDLEELQAEIEERRFREKLYDAMADDYDNRLDGVEAQLNEYAHIPSRWQPSRGAASFEYRTANDPDMMDEEEYAEWIREGMWRRTHKAEMEERDRREAEAKARRERERKAREDSKRLEREEEAKRAAKRQMKELRQHREAWDYYNARWQKYTTVMDQSLGFNDIAWPIFPVVTTTATITEERISEFIFYELNKENIKGRKERIREALLRWHPDKFESKLGSRLGGKEKDLILEGVGIVARCLNNMMARNQ